MLNWEGWWIIKKWKRYRRILIYLEKDKWINGEDIFLTTRETSDDKTT